MFHPHASLLVPAVISAVSDPFYKISSEALLVLQLLVKVRHLGSNLRSLVLTSVVDPYPNWIRTYLPIQRIRIRIHTGKKRINKRPKV